MNKTTPDSKTKTYAQFKANADSGRKLAHSFLLAHPNGALATLGDYGRPDVSIVHCVVSDKLDIFFSTRIESRKYINSLDNPSVAMAFQDSRKMQVLQLSGVAELIDDLKQEQEIMFQLIKTHSRGGLSVLPPLNQYLTGLASEVAILKVEPYEMTFSDFNLIGTSAGQRFFRPIMLAGSMPDN